MEVISKAAADEGFVVPIPTVPLNSGEAIGAFKFIAAVFAVILAVLAATLFVNTNSAAFALVASAVIAVALDVILAVFEDILVFNVVISEAFAFKLIRLDKLVVSIDDPPPPLEKLKLASCVLVT